MFAVLIGNTKSQHISVWLTGGWLASARGWNLDRERLVSTNPHPPTHHHYQKITKPLYFKHVGGRWNGREDPRHWLASEQNIRCLRTTRIIREWRSLRFYNSHMMAETMICWNLIKDAFHGVLVMGQPRFWSGFGKAVFREREEYIKNMTKVTSAHAVGCIWYTQATIRWQCLWGPQRRRRKRRWGMWWSSCQAFSTSQGCIFMMVVEISQEKMSWGQDRLFSREWFWCHPLRTLENLAQITLRWPLFIYNNKKDLCSGIFQSHCHFLVFCCSFNLFRLTGPITSIRWYFPHTPRG